MTTFTTLLRGLSPLGDALERTTYDDSVARPKAKGGVTERRAKGRGRFWFRRRGHTSLEGAHQPIGTTPIG